MLDVRFFRNPRFTAASLTVTLVFFALFGFIFLATQYLQFVLRLHAARGRRPHAAVRGGDDDHRAALVEVRRAAGHEARRRHAACSCSRPAWSSRPRRRSRAATRVCWSRCCCSGAASGLAVAPSTESIMGSLPRHQAGVGSAVNDTSPRGRRRARRRGHRQPAVVDLRVTGARPAAVGGARRGAGRRERLARRCARRERAARPGRQRARRGRARSLRLRHVAARRSSPRRSRWSARWSRGASCPRAPPRRPSTSWKRPPVSPLRRGRSGSSGPYRRGRSSRPGSSPGTAGGSPRRNRRS